MLERSMRQIEAVRGSHEVRAGAGRSGPRGPATRPLETTFLALVDALANQLDDDAEVVETVQAKLESGRVRLIGYFGDRARLRLMDASDQENERSPW